jgi:TolB-like protein/tetratricopeptide (TPR) repeat protein/tRNA A-37 threonylcarbamoyl transferase component Bud32
VNNQLEQLRDALAERYRVGDEIGRGGMATVYRAHDLKHDRSVALKVLKPELAAALGTERFLREITLTARLDHPHILPLLDSGEAAGLLYYVMPYVEGESLRARLDREKQLPLDDALRIAREVADALSYAHQQGVVHRDIKPGNILLARGHARVADLGIARAVTAAGGQTLTETGLAVGTPAYMSPEQASGEREVDARSDVYSLGCVVYEMLAGQPPYTGATAGAVLARKVMEPVPSLRVVRETVPVGVEQAVTKALAKAPADRFGSALQFAEALEAGPHTATQPIPAPRIGRRAPLFVGMLALAGLAAVLLISNAGGIRSRVAGGSAGAKIQSLAVLPLENHSGDPQQDYLAAGMHEALILELGRLSGLSRVSARGSVMRYQKTDKSARQIGTELGVDAVITGTVLRSGDRVRITAHLTRAANEEPLWSDGYERELRDVLALQHDVVAAIAKQVELQLSPREQAGLSRTRRVNPEAYEAYLKGKFQLNKFTPESFQKALELLQQAVAIDSTEPQAWAGLSQLYGLMEIFTPVPTGDAIPRAKAAALRALELDETLAEAHVALADIRDNEWDYARAEQSYLRALELNPNLPDAHIHYGWHLAIFGTEEAAIAAMERGVALDPLSPLYASWFAGMYWEFGRFDEAIREANKAMELQADFPVALFVLGLAHQDQGHHAEAIAFHERAVAKYPNQSMTWTLARTYALTGRTADARKIMRRLESGGPPGDALHPWFIATAYAALREDEKAMDWLEKAYDARILFLPNLKRERAAGGTFQTLRTNPRFQALLRRLNLTQ